MIRFGFEFKSRKARDNYVDNLLEIKHELNLGSAIEMYMHTNRTMSVIFKNTRRIQYSYFTTSEVTGCALTIKNKTYDKLKLLKFTNESIILEGIKKFTVTAN